MSKRPDRDTVTIESVQGGDFAIVVDRATQYEITNDLLAPATARFELGDEKSWSAVKDAVAIGTRFVVSVNGFPRLTGRLLTRGLSLSASGGATLQLTVRTYLADAMFTAVDPKIGTKNATLRDIILAAYAQLGIGEDGFIFKADVARDLVTGKSSSSPAPPGLSELKADEARPNPPESVFAFVDRHLSRFGLLQWDGPNGRIVIAKPDDTQAALYKLTARRGDASRANNIISATKTEDFEEVPRDLFVYGVGGGKDQAKSKVQFVRTDPILSAVDPKLNRTVVIIDDALKTQAQAEARARREMLQRSMAKDAWTLELDGFSYWSGEAIIPYVIDTVADVQIDAAAASSSGPYLVRQVTMRGDAQNGHTTQLACVARGIWDL